MYPALPIKMLRARVVFLQTLSSEDPVTEEPQQIGETQSTPASRMPAKKRRPATADLADVAQECLNEFRRSNEAEKDKSSDVIDDDVMYGQHVSAEMKKLDNEVIKQMVKSEIQGIFMRAHMGCYNNPNSFLSRQPWQQMQSNTYFPGANVQLSSFPSMQTYGVAPPSNVSSEVPWAGQQGSLTSLLGPPPSQSSACVSLSSPNIADM